MSTQTLQIQGMTCGACVARVEQALASVPGVDSCAVNLATNLATVSSSAGPTDLVAAVRAAGYDAIPIAEGGAAGALRKVAADQDEDFSRVRRRLAIGVLAAVPIFLFDFFHARIAAGASPAAQAAISVAEFLFATLIVLFTGRPFFTGALRAVRHGATNMDVLIALGSGVAYVFSIFVTAAHLATLAGDHRWHLMLHPEYHAVAAILVLVTLGKYLEARAKRASNTAVAGLAAQSASLATRLGDDGAVETVPAEQIAVGDRVQILAHQPLPVDGVLLEGSGSLDLSVITGESVPIVLSGVSTATLPAGARLLDGRIVLRATATAATSTVARILALVQSAQAGKTQIQSLADRIAAIFVPIVLFLAAVTFAGWFFTGHSFAQSLIPAIATVVIACPCAMGLATPTAITVAVGVAARRGILFTRADVLERVGRVGAVAFDKTGTLTQGRPRVVDVEVIGNTAFSSDELLRIAASVEQFSDHPLAVAITQAWNGKSVDAAPRGGRLTGAAVLDTPTSFNSVAGGGVRADFSDGSQFAAGSVAYLRSLNIDVGAAGALRSQTVVALADLRAGCLIGVIHLQDALRADAAAAVAWLNRAGVHTAILSGDTESAVNTLARELGRVDLIRAQLRPEEKAAVVARLKKDNRDAVAFVGDGINDAPALAAADLGIAMAAGSDLAKSAGDILLVGNRLAAIPEAWQLSRTTLRVIKQNLFWAFAYNVAAIPLAMLGILPPQVAAGAMMFSSVTVVLNALRLYRPSAWSAGAAGPTDKK